METARRIFAIVALLTALAFVPLLIKEANRGAQARYAAAALMSLEERKTMPLKQWLEDLSFGNYERASKYQRRVAWLQKESGKADRAARKYALGVMISSALALTVALWPASRRTGMPFAAGMIILLAALWWVAGIMVPMLSVEGREKVEILGELVFQYEEKSLVSAIGTLFQANVLLGSLVVAFSVVAPILKLGGMSLLAAGRCERAARFVVRHIGGWSMADFFAAAVFLAFLGLNSTESVHAKIGWGLWFFVGYCLLSFAAGRRLQRTELVDGGCERRPAAGSG